MKKIIFILTFILLITTCTFASNVDLQINGEIINFTDEKGKTVNPGIINSRMMVPMRKIFEILGAEVNWDGETKTVTGTKGNTSIKLQIDNPIATKTINGIKEEIKLDAPPMILYDRTMVPLRFIAESLDKQVGWDADTRTAIIIDYDYFMNDLKAAAPALYNFLTVNNNNVECNITHNYYDLLNSANNASIITKINSKLKNNSRNISLKIEGTNELAKEIKLEGWNDISFSIINNEIGMVLNTDNFKLKEMFGTSEEDRYKTYKDLGIENASTENIFEAWGKVKEEDLKIITFSKLKNDYMNLRNLFSTTNYAGNTKLNSVSSLINYDTYKIEYFDLAKLDNFISNNEHQLIINLVNKLFFKTDILKDVILYDSSKISINFGVDNNIFKTTIVMENEYNEKNEYIIELKNI